MQAENALELRIALRVALNSGYRLIDTAEFYHNEDVIGEVCYYFILYRCC